jgi:mRNA-degrading endonuclease RelE of RelBE toxin-antitoxin system
MREYVISRSLAKTFEKLRKKDAPVLERIFLKTEEIVCGDIDHYKNLRYSFKECKRVHIGSYVLVFTYDVEEDLVTFLTYEHHDTVYER